MAARWVRADGSRGQVTAHFRLKTAERWYVARLLVDAPTSALLRDVPLARIEAAVNADPKIREWVESATPEETVKRVRRAASKRPKLERPTRRRLDDDFYGQVARPTGVLSRTAYRRARRWQRTATRRLALSTAGSQELASVAICQRVNREG